MGSGLELTDWKLEPPGGRMPDDCTAVEISEEAARPGSEQAAGQSAEDVEAVAGGDALTTTAAPISVFNCRGLPAQTAAPISVFDSPGLGGGGRGRLGV